VRLKDRDERCDSDRHTDKYVQRQNRNQRKKRESKTNILSKKESGDSVRNIMKDETKKKDVKTEKEETQCVHECGQDV